MTSSFVGSGTFVVYVGDDANNFRRDERVGVNSGFMIPPPPARKADYPGEVVVIPAIPAPTN